MSPPFPVSPTIALRLIPLRICLCKTTSPDLATTETFPEELLVASRMTARSLVVVWSRNSTGNPSCASHRSSQPLFGRHTQTSASFSHMLTRSCPSAVTPCPKTKRDVTTNSTLLTTSPFAAHCSEQVLYIRVELSGSIPTPVLVSNPDLILRLILSFSVLQSLSAFRLSLLSSGRSQPFKRTGQGHITLSSASTKGPMLTPATSPVRE